MSYIPRNIIIPKEAEEQNLLTNNKKPKENLLQNEEEKSSLQQKSKVDNENIINSDNNKDIAPMNIEDESKKENQK